LFFRFSDIVCDDRGLAGEHTFRLKKGTTYTLTVHPLEAIDPDDGTVSLWWNLWSEDGILINGYPTSYSSPVSDGSGNIGVYTYIISAAEDPEALALEISVQPTIGIGETTLAVAEPADKEVTWSIIKREPDDGSIVASIDASSGVITVSERSGPGKITIQAEYQGTCCSGPCPVKDDAEIEITCCECSQGVCPVPGSGKTGLHSIDLVLYLGNISNGKSAGRLFIQSEKMRPELATPAGLHYDGVSAEVEVIKWTHCWLRQLMAPQALVDIVVIDEFKYDIRFYYPNDAGSKNALGLYEPTGAPFVVWTIENPDASATTYNRLGVTKTVETAVTVSEYVWNAGTTTWSLSTGNGLKTETKQDTPTGTGRVVTRTVKDADGAIASNTVTTYRTFPWGEDVIEEVIDPNDAALTTTTTYYETLGQPGYGRIHTVTHPDGSQVEYVYNADDTVQEVREHWKDTPNGKITLYDYTPIDAGDDGSVRPRAARTMTEQVGDVTVAKTYRAYFGDTEIVEQAAEPPAPYGDPRNQRSTTTYYPESAPEVEADKIHQTVSPDGRTTSYTYEQGTLAIGSVSDPDTYVFTPGTGTARRTIVTQGPETAGKTTHEVSLFNDQGYQVLTQTEVYTGSGYERVRWTIDEHNQLGQVIQRITATGQKLRHNGAAVGKPGNRRVVA
jgi:YD repeat-containing protein